jgi:lipoprotein-anchoring transpeptidase ErfK/SrfK
LVALLAALAALGTLDAGLGASGGGARASVLEDPGVIVESSAAIDLPARPLGEPAPEEPGGPVRFLLVSIDRTTPITARPGTGPVVGSMPAGSRFYATPTVAWVHRVSPDGRFGLVDVPYVGEPVSGWIPLRGLDRSWTRISVVADLSEHRLVVRRGGGLLFRAPAATGAPDSPTPLGRYVVTDRVVFPGGGSLGTFAFGISGIQPDLPPGWTGGDQLAIHGTNDQSSIGRSASAGCLRVSERVLDLLRRLLRLGTPVIVRA